MNEILQRIGESGLIAIVRTRETANIMAGVEAAVRGGCPVIEITFSVPQALRVIAEIAEAFSDRVVLGAGTILSPTDAVAAVDAGARYLVAPNVNPDVIGMAKRLDVPVFPGAMSPTEVVDAWNAGADGVKLFPAGTLGPSYVKALRGPLPHIPLVPTGGINLDNAKQYIRAGAHALGVGGGLIDPALLAAENYAEITARAKALCEAVRSARAGS